MICPICQSSECNSIQCDTCGNNWQVFEQLRREDEIADKAYETAQKILKEMPPWQREYADEIIASVTQPGSTAFLTTLPKMFS